MSTQLINLNTSNSLFLGCIFDNNIFKSSLKWRVSLIPHIRHNFGFIYVYYFPKSDLHHDYVTSFGCSSSTFCTHHYNLDIPFRRIASSLNHIDQCLFNNLLCMQYIGSTIVQLKFMQEHDHSQNVCWKTDHDTHYEAIILQLFMLLY